MRTQLVGVALALFAGLAQAQPADVPGQIKFVETQPADMERSQWKEKRRDVVKKLGQSKDKRAVPALIKLAESETFDVVGENAIEALGVIGDQSAVPALQKIANDPARDKNQQALAKKALAKLGASVTPTGGTTGTGGTGVGGTGATPPPDPGAGTGSAIVPEPTDGGLKPPTGDGGIIGSTTGSGTSLLGDKPPATASLPALPSVPDDALAAYERLTIVAGGANATYDGLSDRKQFDLDVAGRFQKRVERPGMAWGFDIDANILAAALRSGDREATTAVVAGVSGVGEARFYLGGLYGIGKFGLSGQLDYYKIRDDMDAMQDRKLTAQSIDIQLALGVGYGRVLDVGGAIRVRRLARVLDGARALGKPIDAATGKQLQLAWWALRGERTTYRALLATVGILREAGILLAEPDTSLAYQLLAVLRDVNLYQRLEGYDVQLAFGEGYLVRERGGATEGRIEQVLFRAAFAKQLADDLMEVSAGAYGNTRIFAPDDIDGQPVLAPFGVGGFARLRKFMYGEFYDPFGAFDLTVRARASGDDRDIGMMETSEIQSRLEAQLGFTYWINQASGLRLAGIGAIDSGELFVGARLEATFGFLDGTFAGL